MSGRAEQSGSSAAVAVPRVKCRRRRLPASASLALAATVLCAAALLTGGTRPVAASAGGRAYVLGGNPSALLSVDTSTNDVIGTVAIDRDPQDVAVSPDGNRAYVTRVESLDLSVVDTSTNLVTATIRIGLYGGDVEVSPDGSKVYVARNYPSAVYVIDAATNTLVDDVQIGQPFDETVQLAVTPDGGRVYVTNNNFDRVAVIDTSTNTVVTTVPIGSGGGRTLAVTPGGDHVYVAGTDAGVSVVSTATNTVVDTIDVNAGDVAMDPGGARAYMVGFTPPSVLVVSLPSNTVVPFSVGSSPSGLAATPDGALLYVSDFYAGLVSVVDTSSMTVLDTIPVHRPFGLTTAVAPTGSGYSVSDSSTNEGDSGLNSPKLARFVVTRAGNLSTPGSVRFTTGSGTSGNRAIQDTDFKKVDTLVSFPVGVSTVQVPVKVVGDTRPEPTERFRAVLSNPTNGTITDNLGTGTIVDDD